MNYCLTSEHKLGHIKAYPHAQTVPLARTKLAIPEELHLKGVSTWALHFFPRGPWAKFNGFLNLVEGDKNLYFSITLTES